MPDLIDLFGNKKSGGVRITFDIDEKQAKKLEIDLKTNTNTKTTINIFSDPELLDTFKEFCADRHISEEIDFLSKLQKLYEEKVKTGQEPTSEALQKFYNENITAGAEDQMNFSATLRAAIDADLETGKGLESFYSAAQEAFTLLNTNAVIRFKRSEEYREASERYALRAERERLLDNRGALDTREKLEKIEAVNKKTEDKDLKYFTTLIVKREGIFKELKGFEATKSRDATRAIDKIKSIDLMLSKNESAILKNTENKKGRLDNFKEKQKADGEPEKIKKIESHLFEALINERKLLLESAKDFKSSDPEALEKIKYVDFKLTQNENAILKRFENNKEKLDAFTEALKNEAPQMKKFESTLFDVLTNERKQWLESVRNFKSSDPEALKKIKHVDFKLAQSESAILKRFANNKEKLDAFTETLKNEAPQLEQLKSNLFNTLISERLTLIAEQSITREKLKIFRKPSELEEDSKKIENQLKELEEQLKENEKTIQNRFGTDNEKIGIFKEAQKGETEQREKFESELFNALISERLQLFAERTLAKNELKAFRNPSENEEGDKEIEEKTKELEKRLEEKIKSLEEQLKENKSSIENRFITDEKNSDADKERKNFYIARMADEEMQEKRDKGEQISPKLMKMTTEKTSEPTTRGSQSESRGSQSTPKEANTPETSRSSQSKSPEPTTQPTPPNFDTLTLERSTLIAKQLFNEDHKLLLPDFQKELTSNEKAIKDYVDSNPEKKAAFDKMQNQERNNPMLQALLLPQKKEKTLPEKKTTASTLLFKQSALNVKDKDKGSFFRNLFNSKSSDEGESSKSRNSGGPGSRGSRGSQGGG